MRGDASRTRGVVNVVVVGGRLMMLEAAAAGACVDNIFDVEV